MSVPSILGLLIACGVAANPTVAVGKPRATLGLRVIQTASQPEGSQPYITLPAPTGRYRVGRMSFHAVDSTRREGMTRETTDVRELLFHVWYPTREASGPLASFIDLLPEHSDFRHAYRNLGVDRLMRVRAHAIVEPQVANDKRTYPVIVFSHGLGTVSRLYTSFLEDLASHGYIVVGVDHPYFAAALTMPDGRVATNLSRPEDRQRDVIPQAQDLPFVVTALDLLHRGKPATRLAGRLNLRQIGVFGHSRGGFAAAHACYIDRRFKACVNLDGYSMTPAVMNGGVTQPFMLVEEIAPWDPPPSDEELVASRMTRAEADAQAARASMQFETTMRRMTAGAFVVISPGAVHNSFSDMGLIAPERYPAARQDFARTIEITRAYLLAFFDKYLRGRSAPLLEAKSPSYPEVWLTIYRPGASKQVFPGAPTWQQQTAAESSPHTYFFRP